MPKWPSRNPGARCGSQVIFFRTTSENNPTDLPNDPIHGGTPMMLPSPSAVPQTAIAQITTPLLTALFRTMTRIRVAEETIAGLLDKGEVRCPTHLCTGQEAIAAGVCAALQKDDTIF